MTRQTKTVPLWWVNQRCGNTSITHCYARRVVLCIRGYLSMSHDRKYVGVQNYAILNLCTIRSSASIVDYKQHHLFVQENNQIYY